MWFESRLHLLTDYDDADLICHLSNEQNEREELNDRVWLCETIVENATKIQRQ